MFDLEMEVDKWSRDFAGTACGRNDRVEELKDHLFCEIEKNVEEGLNPESAFLAATRRFGISEDLKKEFRKGRSISSLLCDSDAEFGRFDLSTKQLALFTGAYLIFFAVFAFGLAALLRGSDSFSYLSALYVLMFLPILFTSAFRKRSGIECAFFKRMIKKVF